MDHEWEFGNLNKQYNECFLIGILPDSRVPVANKICFSPHVHTSLFDGCHRIRASPEASVRSIFDPFALRKRRQIISNSQEEHIVSIGMQAIVS